MSEIMRSVNTLVVGILLVTGLSCARAQAPATAGTAQPTAKAAAGTSKKGAKARAKPAATKTAPAASPAAEAGAGAEAAEAPAGVEAKLARRDPFESLVSRQQNGSGKNLPPGKAGLQVSTLRLDGIVRSSNGMIAVVSNPQARTYFLREGDQLYDGRVEKIAMDGVSFHEIGKDAFGKPVERQVNKRIYASAGEQQ
jgi:hypothetical protein